MLNTLSPTWVKNVHNLGIGRGTSRGRLSTAIRGKQLYPHSTVNNPTVIPPTIPTNPHLQSTPISEYFNLLINHLSTVSTGPTNNTKKEKERK